MVLGVSDIEKACKLLDIKYTPRKLTDLPFYTTANSPSFSKKWGYFVECRS